MKLFSFRIFAISTFSFETGISTRRCFAPQALRMRVSISAIGSVMLIKSISSSYRIPSDLSSQFAGTCRNEWLPARLAHAGDVARQRQVSETNSADAELPQERARSSAPLTTIVLPYSKLRLPLALLHHGLPCHLQSLSLLVDYCRLAPEPGLSSRRNGIPSSRSNASAWSSLLVVVTKVISIPWIWSTMS